MARPVKEINKEQFDDFAGFCYNKQRRAENLDIGYLIYNEMGVKYYGKKI